MHMYSKKTLHAFNAFNPFNASRSHVGGYYQQDSGCKMIRAAASLVALCS